ncbi:MAG: hypothetical protein WC868_02875 [Bacteroidales bacterium]
MKTINKKQKRNYAKPQIERIKLDNEISVFMASEPNPPGDPTGSIQPDNFSINPFK